MDPLTEAVVALFEDLIGQGVHALDPATRQQAVRDAVAAQRSQWASIVTGSELARVDAMVAAHHVDPLSRPAIAATLAETAPKP